MRNTVRFAMMFALCGMLLVVGYTVLVAQDAPAGGRPGGAAAGNPPAAQPQPPVPAGPGGPGGPGQFDPARMLERVVGMMEERIQQDLEAKDDEWQVIEPLLSEVVKAQFSQFMSTMGGMFGRGGAPGGAMGFGPAAQEIQALRTALDNPSTSNEDLKAKMKAVRDARKKAEEALQKARENLRKVLTLRQEAKILLAGMLD